MRFVFRELLKESTDSKRVGKIGEAVLAQLVKMHFSSENIFRNVYVKCSNNKKTEIDIIAVDQRGIFVFEMKNYSGYIYGLKKDHYFTQLFSRKQKYQILSPIKQNEYHIKCLQQYLDNEDLPMFNIVVVSNHCNLRLKDINNIIRIKEVENYFKPLINQTLTSDEVNGIIKKLSMLIVYNSGSS